MNAKPIVEKKVAKMPLFFIEGYYGTDKKGMVEQIEKQFNSTLTKVVDEKIDMKAARDDMLSFFDEIERSQAPFDAAIVIDGPVWHFLNAPGAKAEKEATLRRISTEAEKRFAPVMVFMACSKHEAEARSNAKLKGYVEESEKFVEMYRDGLSKNNAFKVKAFINTTYEKGEKPIKKAIRKARKASGQKFVLKK